VHFHKRILSKLHAFTVVTELNVNANATVNFKSKLLPYFTVENMVAIKFLAFSLPNNSSNLALFFSEAFYSKKIIV